MNNDKKLIPELRFPEFLKSEGWQYFNGNILFESISNRNHNSDLPILAITQEDGAIPRELIGYTVNVSKKSIKNYKVVENGDFIISLRSFQGGIECSNYKGLCSPAYIVLRKKVKLENRFFKYYFKTDFYIRQLNKNLEGIRDGKMVSFNQFSEILLPLPAIKEQQKIASCLSSLDELITAHNDKLEALKDHKKGLLQNLFPMKGENLPKYRFPEFKGKLTWQEKRLSEILNEHRLKSEGGDEIYSVSVYKGVVNQNEHLGRRFAAKNTDNYKRVLPGDIIYTKSPTGDFPYGIIKRSNASKPVIVSPLYGVFTPKNSWIGIILDAYFEHPARTNAYLEPIIQKGAKNTINIKNDTFLSRTLTLPVDRNEQEKIAYCLSSLDELITAEEKKVEQLQLHKKGLMQNLFPKIDD